MTQKCCPATWWLLSIRKLRNHVRERVLSREQTETHADFCCLSVEIARVCTSKFAPACKPLLNSMLPLKRRAILPSANVNESIPAETWCCSKPVHYTLGEKCSVLVTKHCLQLDDGDPNNSNSHTAHPPTDLPTHPPTHPPTHQASKQPTDQPADQTRPDQTTPTNQLTTTTNNNILKGLHG